MSPRPNRATVSPTTMEYPWTDDELVKPLGGKTSTDVLEKSKTGQINGVGRKEEESSSVDGKDVEYKLEIVWTNVVFMAALHVGGFYGFYLLFTGQVKLTTIVFGFMYGLLSGFGITGGAHRYWAHRCYKAKTPLRLLLAFLQTIAVQNSIYEWSRDHRVHHKFTETNADPHNAKRGFFFAHVGWLLCKKHPDVIRKGKTVDMSDLDADPIVQFQHKYYKPLAYFSCFVLPTWISWYFFGETLATSFYASALTRYILSLNGTWCVNSAAHLFGSHPYDATINPAENGFVSTVALGEGWHNYHHTFPWDYRTSELSPSKHNFTTRQIDRFARIGWAYDLKTVPRNVMLQRIARTGDGTYEDPLKETQGHGHHGHGHIDSGPWGWGDPDIPAESVKITEILYPDKKG